MMELKMCMLFGAVLFLSVYSVESARRQYHHIRVPNYNFKNPPFVPPPSQPAPKYPPFVPPPFKPVTKYPPFVPHTFKPVTKYPPFVPHTFKPVTKYPPFVPPTFKPAPVYPPFVPPPVQPPPIFPPVVPPYYPPHPINPVVPPLPKPIHPVPHTHTPAPPTTTCDVCNTTEVGFKKDDEKFMEIDECLKNLTDLADSCTPQGSPDLVCRVGASVTCPEGAVVISCACTDANPVTCTGPLISDDFMSCSSATEVIAICAYNFNDMYSHVRTATDAVDCPAGTTAVECIATTQTGVNGDFVTTIPEILVADNECRITTPDCNDPDNTCDMVAVCKMN